MTEKQEQIKILAAQYFEIFKFHREILQYYRI